MSNGAKRNKKIGTIRWAIVLAFIVTFFSVVSYLLTMAISFKIIFSFPIIKNRTLFFKGYLS